MNSANPQLLWLYLMSMKDGEILFTVDSVPEDDPELTDPGTVYLEPPAQLFDVFEQGQAQVVGPYTDEYGIVPLRFCRGTRARHGPDGGGARH